jgi:hypothetical protein
MQLSEDTLAVINYLHEAIEGGLRKRNDVAVVLELAASTDDAETFNSVTRLGTGAWKVYSTLRRVKPGDEGYRLLEEEFARQINDLRENLATLMNNADDETLKRFDEVYFGMTQGVLRNLVDLSHDLSKIKDLQRG